MVGISSGRTTVHVQIKGKYLSFLFGSKGESRLLITSGSLACIYYFDIYMS
jgi:hypothetical protein